MVNINLLPWRVYDRAYKALVIKKFFLFTFLLHAIMVLSVFLILTRINDLLETNREALKTQYQKEKTASSINLNWKHHSSNDYSISLWKKGLKTLRLFNLIQKNTSKDVCLTLLKRRNHKLLFVGKSRSIFAFNHYVHRLEQAHFFSLIKLEDLTWQLNQVQFRLVALENSSDA